MKDVVVDAKTTYRVPDHLELIRKIGSGAYGCVASFKDENTGEQIAIKKIQNAFDDVVDGKRILREIKLLRHFEHENVIRILDMLPPANPDFEDIYIITDLMETDLHHVIYSKQPLTEEHHQYFTYQILRGLLYLHSANVLHRDLKPANILVNKNCDLKICDFGLARGFEKEEDDSTLTDYVVTRWYRAPEVVLLASEYTKAIDIWSVGCILCELIGRKPLFTGKDHIDQVRRIVEITGKPTEEELKWLPKEGPARRFMGKIPDSKGKDFSSLYPKASPECLNLVTQMLRFHPYERISIQECLKHPFFKSLYQQEDQIECKEVIDWKFDDFQPTKISLQEFVFLECAKFHPEIVDEQAPMIAKRDDLRKLLKKHGLGRAKE